VYKVAASAAQLANCILLYAQLLIHLQLQLPAARAQTKITSYCLFNELA